MLKWVSISIASSVLAVFPLSVAAKCYPQNPYFYLSRGAYLLVFLALGLAITLELFRYVVKTETAQKRLHHGAIGFLITALIIVLVACAYSVLEQSWQAVYGAPRLDAARQYC